MKDISPSPSRSTCLKTSWILSVSSKFECNSFIFVKNSSFVTWPLFAKGSFKYSYGCEDKYVHLAQRPVLVTWIRDRREPMSGTRPFPAFPIISKNYVPGSRPFPIFSKNLVPGSRGNVPGKVLGFLVPVPVYL